MRSLLLICFFTMLANGVVGQEIPAISVPKIEGGTQSLSAYNGKKILVITVPLLQTPAADSLLYSLDTLAAAHAQELKVIAVPSVEDGYTPSQKDALLEWYRSKLGANIIITDGLYTHRASGTQQHPLFRWLTDLTQNEAFGIDAAGPNYKFFIDGSGKLYAVLLPQTKMHGLSVQKVIQMQ